MGDFHDWDLFNQLFRIAEMGCLGFLRLSSAYLACDIHVSPGIGFELFAIVSIFCWGHVDELFLYWTILVAVGYYTEYSRQVCIGSVDHIVNICYYYVFK